jgi:hypothetical protein
VPPDIRSGQRFYPLYAAQLLGAVFTHYPDLHEPIVIVTDRLPIKRDQTAAAKAFKTYVRNYLGTRVFVLVHHSSAAHGALQAADYCMWAIHRKWARKDARSYALIQPFVRSETLIGPTLDIENPDARNDDPPSYPAVGCAEEPHGLLLPGGDLSK